MSFLYVEPVVKVEGDGPAEGEAPPEGDINGQKGQSELDWLTSLGWAAAQLSGMVE